MGAKMHCTTGPDALLGSGSSPNEWLTSEWIANDLQVPIATYYQWRSAGKAPRSIKVGKYVRVRRGDYEAWLATLKDGS